jgi:hypothetical protein
MSHGLSGSLRFALIGLILFTGSAARAQQSATVAAPATKADVDAKAGQRVFVCGHSFHIFVARHLADMARDAGLTAHETLGAQMIGGSSVKQHWDLPAEKNKVKPAIESGKVDVLTLSPNWYVPDVAIGQFTELALKHNPSTKVVVQVSWAAFDSDGFKPLIRDNRDRDTKTLADFEHLLDLFHVILELQAKQINAQHGRQVITLAPVGTAVVKLRAKVIAGEVPGIKKQSELFTDPIGHATMPIVALCCYVNYAVIYGKSPVGLKTFVNAKDPNSAKLQQLLQEIAWDTVTSYEPSGVKKPLSGE